jgi:predicted ATPase
MEGWFLSYFVANRARESTAAGYAEHLAREGENLALVIQYLQEKHGPVFGKILERLARRVPGLQGLQVEQTVDGRVVLRVKDTPFARPFAARYVSDGTMKMLAYLVLLNDPVPPPLLCIEEPENNLHPRLLAPLAEEFRAHARQTQVFISSHSPYFVDALQLPELWWMERGPDGYAKIGRVADRAMVEALVREQLTLGSLWFEGHLGGGNP